MDELEQRLSKVLTEAGERADPVAARLRNPATAPPRKASRPAAWLVAASGVAVAVVAVGVVAGVPSMTEDTGPASSTWTLTVTENDPLTFDQLLAGDKVSVPVPYTVDPDLVPELAAAPTLVTEAGPIRFPGSRAVHLLAQRDTGVFIAVTRAGGGDGLYDVDFQLVTVDNARRTLHHAAQAGSVAVSPDGTLLAVSTWLGPDSKADEPAVELVDVASGRVTHRLPGHFTQMAWASGAALVLTGEPGEANSLAWREPWTGQAEQIPVRAGTALAVAGGLVAVDDTTGCLRKLDSDATVIGVNCHGWKSAGDVSPDGRYVSLEWAGGGTTRYGFLDLGQDRVRSWPVPGLNPSWLGPDDVLLTEDTVEDTPRRARCDLTTHTCVRAPDDLFEGAWRGASWIGG